MPKKQKALCNYPGCREFATFGTKCEKHKVNRDESRQRNSYDTWYNRAAWKRLRNTWLNEHPLCEECLRSGEIVQAEVVDHIDPHRGDWTKFMDRGNLQSLCKPCHDRKTASEDGGFGNRRKDDGRVL